MKIIVELLKKAVQKLTGGGKPSPKMQPKMVQPVKPSKSAAAKPEAAKADKPEQSSRFWQDRVDAPSSDPVRNWRGKYRDILENQDHDITPKH